MCAHLLCPAALGFLASHPAALGSSSPLTCSTRLFISSSTGRARASAVLWGDEVRDEVAGAAGCVLTPCILACGSGKRKVKECIPWPFFFSPSWFKRSYSPTPFPPDTPLLIPPPHKNRPGTLSVSQSAASCQSPGPSLSLASSGYPVGEGKRGWELDRQPNGGHRHESLWDIVTLARVLDIWLAPHPTPSSLTLTLGWTSGMKLNSGLFINWKVAACV